MRPSETACPSVGGVRRLAALTLSAAILLAGCSSGDDDRSAEPKRSTSPSASPSPSLSPTPKPTPKPAYVHPFIGSTTTKPGPVLALKIDNVRAARPPVGLEHADLVYVELIEGGATRLLSVFSSKVPEVAGPIRSVRESDIEILRPFGKVAFGFAGGNTGVYDTVMRAGTITDVNYLTRKSLYYRSGRAKAPYNLMTNPVTLLRVAKGAAVARDIGLRFRASDPRISALPASAGGTARFSPAARVGFRWDAGTRKWALSVDGRPWVAAGGGQLRTPNVIVQFVPIKPSRYVDQSGARTPYTVTIGKGRALLFRDGRRADIAWTRPHAGTGTRYVDGSGKDVPLAAGGAWILLVPAGNAVTAP